MRGIELENKCNMINKSIAISEKDNETINNYEKLKNEIIKVNSFKKIRNNHDIL